MAGAKLLAKALSILSPHIRRLATTASAGVNLKPSPEKSASVLQFLRGRGLNDDVVAGFAPRLLNSKVGKFLPAKFDLLLTHGFSGPEAAKVLRIGDLLQRISLNALRRRLDSIRAILSDDAALPLIVTRSTWPINGSQSFQRMIENMSKLRGLGVSDAKIKSLLVSQPRFFVQVKPQSIDDAAHRALAEFGFRRDSGTFPYAVKVLSTTSESTVQSKFRVFESLGWERSDVLAMFKAFPNCVALSDATLVEKLSFFKNNVGLDPSRITKKPKVLGYSMKKRVRPRFELVNAFKSKALLPKDLCFFNTCFVGEKEFMEKYVVKFMKVEPAICNAYIQTVASATK